MRVGRKVGRGGIQPGDRADSAREERASPSLIRAEFCSELEMQGCQRAEAARKESPASQSCPQVSPFTVAQALAGL